MKKIPCVALVYAQFDVMVESVNSILDEQLSLAIVENPSPITLNKSMPFFFDLLKKRKIDSYFVFHENIRFNAIETIFLDGQIDLSDTDYVITTDADIIAEPNYLVEQKNILMHNPEVFCCSVQIDFTGYPSEGYNSAQRWFPPRIKETDSYIGIQGYGHHLNMFRRNDFISFFNYLQDKNKSYVDTELMEYILNQSDRIWGITKHRTGKHLTPELQKNINETFYLWSKNRKDPNLLWKHSEYCGYTKYQLESGTGKITCDFFGGKNEND
jgi:hypothetical protein